MSGLDWLADGLGRLKDVFGRLGLIEGLGLGATGLDWLDMRFCMPLGALGRGAGCAIGDGPRLIWGLGLELNDRDPIDPPGLTDGLEGICGGACALGAALLALIREAASLLRPRAWPNACDPADRVIPTTTATTSEPGMHFFTLLGPAARQ
jgi:hypothetical protein